MLADTPETRAYVKEALRGLTPTQKRHVLNGCISGSFNMSIVRELKRKGLFYLHIDSPNGLAGFMKLTPLGDTVRAALMERAANPIKRSA